MQLATPSKSFCSYAVFVEAEMRSTPSERAQLGKPAVAAERRKAYLRCLSLIRISEDQPLFPSALKGHLPFARQIQTPKLHNSVAGPRQIQAEKSRPILNLAT